MLALSNITILFHIKANSLDFATDTVFSQRLNIDSKWYPVVLFSKSFSPIKCNYKIYNNKMLAIIQALKEW